MPVVALPLVLVAAVLFCVWFAAYQLHITALQGIADQGGTVGELLLKWFLHGVDWAVRQAENTVRDAASGLIGLFSIPIHWLQSHFDTLANGLFGAYTAILRLSTVTVPHLIGQALSVARGWVNTAEQLAAANLAQAYHWAAGQFTAVYRYVNTEITLAENYTGHLFAQAEAYAAAGIEADARYAQGLFTTAIGYTDAEIKSLSGWVTGELGQVTTWAGTEITSLQGYISAIQTQTLAWTTALVGPIALDLANLKAECTDGLCANLGGLANVVESLAGGLGIAALIAFAAEAAADPVGTADATARVLAPVAAGAASGYSALAGVL